MNPLKQIAEQSIAFVRRAGLQMIECRPGYAACCMPLSGNENHMGAMYAGALFTLADITGGVLALSSFDHQRYYPLLKDLTMQFLLPAQSDITLSYQFEEGELANLLQAAERDGKARFVLQGELKNADGVVVAIAKGEFQVRAMVRQIL